MKLKIVSSLLLCGLPITTAVAASDVVDAFLATGEAAPLQLPDAPSASWFDSPQLRVTPEIDADGNWTSAIRVRFRPLSRGERRADQRLYEIEDQLTVLNAERRAADDVARRYGQLVDLLSAEVTLARRQQDFALAELQLQLANSESASAQYRPGRLQQAVSTVELARARLARERLRVDAERRSSVGAFFRLTEDALALPSYAATPNQITQHLNRLERAPSPEANSFPVRSTRLDVENARQRLAHYRASTRVGLNLLELGYQDSRTDSYAVRFGVSLPIGQRTPARARRVRDLAAAEDAAYHAALRARETIKSRLTRLHWLVAAHESDLAAIETIERRQPPGDREALLVRQQHLLALRESAVSIHLDVMRAFIDLLHVRGELNTTSAAGERINWLRETDDG